MIKLICRDCGADWNEFGNAWKRSGSNKIDYRCSKCRSKLVPKLEENPVIEDSFCGEHENRIVGGQIFKGVGGETKGATKKLLIISDLHSGHLAGLTPPEYRVNPYDQKHFDLQKECWEFYSGTLKDVGHVDVVVCNGDAIDGKGSRSGGSEQITTDLLKQSEIAIRCIDEINFDKLYLTHGTPYHAGTNGEDFEEVISKHFNGVIKDHLWLDINGCIFDFKHKIGGSSVLSSRVGALIKEYQWNQEWAKLGSAPNADVFIRSHVHYHMSVSDPFSFYAMTTPALQAPDTKYGGRQCSGTVHFGLTLIEIPTIYNKIDDLNIKVFKKVLESSSSRSIVV